MSRPAGFRQLFLKAAPLALLATGAALLSSCSDPASAWPDGLAIAPDAPRQQSLQGNPWLYDKGVYLSPMASYHITARVLSVKTYAHGSDDLSVASPIDFALGWGEMSKSEVIRPLSIRQGTRFYSYQWRGTPPISPRLIAISSANVHLVPADPDISRRLHEVSAGDKVTLVGKLVEVSAPFGKARSSLVRTDTGGGACEIMWVERLEVEPAP